MRALSVEAGAERAAAGFEQRFEAGELFGRQVGVSAVSARSAGEPPVVASCGSLYTAVLGPVDITTFNDSPMPPGESPFVSGHGPTTGVSVAEYDASWPARFERLAGLIRTALGPTVLALDHVGSTAVPGLAAKPVIDVDLTVADGAAESTYVSPLETCGFQLVIREAWWYGHRLLRHANPACNLHIWSPDCPETARHLIFRDWLRANPEECLHYARAKRAASEQTVAVGGSVEAYNARKQSVIREIYDRAFAALGLA